MATNNTVNTSLSGQTGTGTFVGSNSPLLVTPTLGAAVATSLNFLSSTIGIIGSTTNNAATVGSVGEFISATSALNTTSITSGTSTDILSISLTAGDWEVGGNIGFFGASLTTVSLLEGWINTTSASNPGGQFASYVQPPAASTPFITAPLAFVVPSQRISIASTTTVYLSTLTAFAISTLAAGGQIWARRMR